MKDIESKLKSSFHPMKDLLSSIGALDKDNDDDIEESKD
jgi:hypothetical protein